VAQVARTKTRGITNDVRQAQGFLPNPLLPHTRAELAVPLIVRDQLLGVLDVQSDVVKPFYPGRFENPDHFGRPGGVAMQNANQFQETQAALAITEALYQVTQSLTAAETLEELHIVAADRIAHALPVDRVTLCTIDLEAHHVMGYARSGPGAHRQTSANQMPLWQELQTGLAGLAVRTQKQ
jgi:GAF domain-containing protein